ncbi:MAG: (d)CMP kinase [Candidatus Margulisbacteria bacterium]|nr:(d)CMP kinase [Candidatus Margulisiibacteriota bacterium]
MTKKKLIIAIDGPAGSGKSTIAKLVAEELGYCYIDTGALYRYITLHALEAGIDFKEEKKIADLVNKIDFTKIPYDKIRANEISKLVSIVAKIPEVRHNLIPYQRKLAENGEVVMDGRDIGSVILPNAEVKIFLTASVEERAKRRYLELKEKDLTITLAGIQQEIIKRDEIDSKRAVNPMQVAKDAVVLDTTNLAIPEVVQEIMKIINMKAKHYG